MERMRHHILLFVLVLTITSCQRTWHGEGAIVEDKRDLKNFNKVALNMNATVIVTDGPENSCVIKAQQNLKEAIVTRLDGNVLIITSKGTIETNEPIVIEITLSRPIGFEVNGTGKIKTANTLKNDAIDIDIAGSGSMEADVVTNKLTGVISGSGVMNVTGTTNNFDIEINGSGTVNGYGLNVLDSRARISGSGEIFLNVSHTLHGKVDGSGLIRYKGDAELSRQISGSGNVEKWKQ